MTRSQRLLLVPFFALLASAPAAATTGKSAKTSPAAKPAARHAAPAKARAKAAPASPSAERRLDEVRIEGELEVPRVTFITVRQPHRFHDYTRATSVRPSRRMAAEATFPSWIPPVPTAAGNARKENRK